MPLVRSRVIKGIGDNPLSSHPESYGRAWLRGVEAAGSFLLPVRELTSGRRNGELLGVGAGSSIEFHDHRNYMVGDDPRFVNWGVLARTGALVMKVFRSELTPHLDLVVDVSGSMALKAERAIELMSFVIAAAARQRLSSTVHQWGGTSMRFETPEIYRQIKFQGEVHAENLARLPLRRGSLRILISDLLFQVDPRSILQPLAAGAGKTILFAPYLEQETFLEADGIVQMEDAEHGTEEALLITDAVAAEYRQRYERHWVSWAEAAMRFQANLARVPAEGTVLQALRGDSLRSGAVQYGSQQYGGA